MKKPITDLSQVPNLEIVRLKRAREVKQSYFTSIFTTLYALCHSLWVVATAKPDLIVSNGPGTAVPLVIANLLVAKLLLRKTKTLYIESFCRVESLSLSGKILRPLADKFIVQWRQLKERYPDTVYLESKIL